MKNNETLRFIIKATLITAVALLIAFLGYSEKETQNDYEQGWMDGYPKGYCYRDLNCISPIPPVCPVPDVTEENTYNGGYARGFYEGQKDSQEGR
jgi:hypothetical protein